MKTLSHMRIIFVLSLFFLVGCKGPSGKLHGDTFRDPRTLSDEVGEGRGPQIDKFFSEIEKEGFRGVVYVRKEGKLLIAKGYGYANEAKKVRNGRHMIYDIASISKQFTAAAILKLEMQGKLKINENVNQFWDEKHDVRTSMTVHHLLTHTSGINPTAWKQMKDLLREGKIRKEHPKD